MSFDGSVILAAGHTDKDGRSITDPREPLRERSNVAEIDPQTLEVRRIFEHPAMDGFVASTTATRIGNEIWLGSYRGDRIAYFPVPEQCCREKATAGGSFPVRGARPRHRAARLALSDILDSMRARMTFMWRTGCFSVLMVLLEQSAGLAQSTGEQPAGFTPAQALAGSIAVDERPARWSGTTNTWRTISETWTGRSNARS